MIDQPRAMSQLVIHTSSTSGNDVIAASRYPTSAVDDVTGGDALSWYHDASSSSRRAAEAETLTGNVACLPASAADYSFRSLGQTVPEVDMNDDEEQVAADNEVCRLLQPTRDDAAAPEVHCTSLEPAFCSLRINSSTVTGSSNDSSRTRAASDCVCRWNPVRRVTARNRHVSVRCCCCCCRRSLDVAADVARRPCLDFDKMQRNTVKGLILHNAIVKLRRTKRLSRHNGAHAIRIAAR